MIICNNYKNRILRLEHDLKGRLSICYNQTHEVNLLLTSPEFDIKRGLATFSGNIQTCDSN